jgi:c-di-GMP-binding flagellar brake protein YcgR
MITLRQKTGYTETTQMVQKETLTFSEMKRVFSEAQQEKAPIIGSFMVDGKWRLIELHVCGCSDDFIDFNSQTSCEKLKDDQPIGICIHLGHFKYLFDSTVLATESQVSSWRILLNPPDRVERIERRVYHRQPVPANTTVKVLFWHRGYLDDSENEPAENYWQGTLLNLSAGGARFEIEIDHKENFRTGQLLGMQFTPMSYQKPLLLESHVKYAEEQSDNRYFRIGVEFLGLEASPEGRHILDRILEVISQYETMNAQENPCPKGS